jgi:hypothetical protein
MRRTLLPLAILSSLAVASTSAAQEAVTVAPLPPPPPPLPPPPPPPPPPTYAPPPQTPPAREVVYLEETSKHEAPVHSNEGFSFGVELNSFQFDFGFGGRIATPSIGHFLRIAGSGGVAWFPNAPQAVSSGCTGGGFSGKGCAPAATLDTWDAYYYGRLQIELTGPQLGPVRTYAFAGAILLGVPSDLSSTEIDIGGVGGFGFEFLLGRYSSYFVELGALGTGATADHLVDSPTFANGFLITVGSRFYP